MKKNLIKIMILLTAIILISCSKDVLDGTYIDEHFESINKGNIERFEFSPDGKYIFTWIMPKITAPNMLDVDIENKGTYEIIDDVIMFTVTEEKSLMYGKDAKNELPYNFQYNIVFRNENTLEIKRDPNEGEDPNDYGSIKLTKK